MARRRSPSPPSVSSNRPALIGLAVVAAILCGGMVWWIASGPRIRPEQLLAESRAERRAGHFAQAEKLAAKAFDCDAELVEAALLAGECAEKQKAWTRALEYYRKIDSQAPAHQLSARLREAELLHRYIHHLGEAERAYRAALEIDPDNIEANKNLANLLSLCGRMREATPLVLRLIRQGNEPDLLLLLVRGEMAVDDQALLKAARTAAPTDPNPLLGLAWHALDNDRIEEAENLLRSAIELDKSNMPARLLFGRLLLKAERSAEFATWSQQLPAVAGEGFSTWLLRGQMADAVGDRRGAIRAYGEAVRRGPESKTATFRLAHLLAEAGETQATEALRKRMQHMIALEEMQNRVLFAADRGRPELLQPLAQAYEAAGRLWEAYGWCQFAVEMDPNSAALRSYAERLRRKLKDELLQLVTNTANVAASMDFSPYPLPTLQAQSESTPHDQVDTAVVPTFRDDAASAGMNFRYFNGVTGPPTHRMFEFPGGGVGVLDYDRDDYADIVLTQGRTWPPGSPDTSSGDRLFRNRDGSRLEDVTDFAGLNEDGYGQGVTIGDYNADGFPDIYAANIGINRLWLNHGDGTFQDATDEAGLKSDSWTTSTIMVDLTGDGLPDIYDANYLTAEDIYDRVCRHADGSLKQCLPQDFYGQADQLWLNLGDGRFRDATAEILGEVPLGMGLGVAAWDADGTGRLSLFVANDTTPSFFFRPEGDGKHPFRLRECGIEAGVAFNGAGKATGCMGVAVGDIDDDGRMDFYITNFYAEPNTLFVNSTPGFFEDQTRKRGLEASSFDMLGFGTQFLDADLDGRWELFVANGHLDDLTRFGRPYKMPAQLFRLDRQGRFVELPKEKIGPYFEQKWLGRPAARVDWNRDGRDDLVVGDLFEPVALLTNTTAAVGQHLSLQLIGVESNREAIGTTVQARIGSRTIVRQLTAGDGYQCSNERRLIFGIGNATKIDELTVRWPSGRVQQFTDVAVPVTWQLREGQQPFVRGVE